MPQYQLISRLSWPKRPPEGLGLGRVRVPFPRSQKSGRRVSVRLGLWVVALMLGSG